MRPIAKKLIAKPQPAAGALLSLIVVAWLAFGSCHPVLGQDAIVPQWNATQASSVPWGQSESGAVLDANVRPADFRSTGAGTVQNMPPVDFATRSGVAESAADGLGDLSSTMNLEFDLASPEPSGQTDWSARFRDLLRSQTGSINWTRMLGSLAIVVGGFFLMTWLFRLVSPRSNGRLPASVFELVGSARLNSRQSLQVVRVGSRLLMLIVSPEGAQAVGEISHPGEVESLVAECVSGGQKKGARSRSGWGATAGGSLTASGRDTSALLEQLVQSLQKPAGQSAVRTEFEV